jgi:hypothetical protein
VGLLNPLLGTRKRLCQFFLYRSKNHFSSYLFCQRLLFILYSGLSFGLCLGSGAVVDKQRERKYGGGHISCEQIELLYFLN